MTTFADEDIYAAPAVALRKAGLDTVSTSEAGRIGASDDSQLAGAAGRRRALETFNVARFSALHSTWIGTGRHHADIVVSSQRPPGDVVRHLIQLADTLVCACLADDNRGPLALQEILLAGYPTVGVHGHRSVTGKRPRFT